jgi:hypothetical protein
MGEMADAIDAADGVGLHARDDAGRKQSVAEGRARLRSVITAAILARAMSGKVYLP